MNRSRFEEGSVVWHRGRRWRKARRVLAVNRVAGGYEVTLAAPGGRTETAWEHDLEASG